MAIQITLTFDGTLKQLTGKSVKGKLGSIEIAQPSSVPFLNSADSRLSLVSVEPVKKSKAPKA